MRGALAKSALMKEFSAPFEPQLLGMFGPALDLLGFFACPLLLI
jgi:hypothetical protein